MLDFLRTHDGFGKDLERRRQSRDILIGSCVGMDSSLWELKLADCGLRGSDLDSFKELSESVSDRNVFYDHDFFSASHERLGNRLKKLIILSEIIDEHATLKLVFPVQVEKVGIPQQNVLRVWSHPYAPLSQPLFDQSDKGRIVEIFLKLLHESSIADWSAIVFEDLPLNSAFADEVSAESVDNANVSIVKSFQRAMILPRSNESYPADVLSPKRSKELRRLERKLARKGRLKLEIVDDLMGCLLRFEEFLLLETRSWKGKRGTSLHMIKRTAAFARQAIANLVSANACRIYSLRLDNRPLASVIVFRSGGWYFPWKIACDEQYLKYSIGKLLLIKVTKDLLDQPDFAGADSLSAPDNFMINQIWPDRRSMGELVIGFGSGSQAKKVIAAIKRGRRLKQTVKWMLGRK